MKHFCNDCPIQIYHNPLTYLFIDINIPLNLSSYFNQTTIYLNSITIILQQYIILMYPSPQKRKARSTPKFIRKTLLLQDEVKPVALKSIKCSNQSEADPMDNFVVILKNNRKWAKRCVEDDPFYFTRLLSVQTPKYLWIGCSDSRVPANEIVGLKPGQIFVHRNVANQAPPSDINAMAVIQYAVQVLKVTDIMVTGHYGCGGIKASFRTYDHGPIQAWLSHIRELRYRYKQQLNGSQEENEDKLTELNVKDTVFNISKLACVQQAWKNGDQVRIHGLVYKLGDGILKDLKLTLTKLQHVPKQYKIIQ